MTTLQADLPTLIVEEMALRTWYHGAKGSWAALKKLLRGFPSGSVVKNLLSMQETCRRCRFNRWVEKIPWRRKWQPIPVFLPGKSHEQRSLVGCSPWGHKSWTQWSDWTTTKKLLIRTALVVQWLRLHAGGAGSILGLGIKIPHDTWPKN